MTPRPILALLLMVLAPSVQAEIVGGEQAYRDCLALARSKPDEGLERAAGLIGLGAGAPARHCQAVALTGLGRYREAGEALERLVNETKEPALRVEALGQAGNAWMLAGDLPRAAAAFGQALKLAPDDVEMLIDRAIALAGAANYFEAIDDLNRAIELAPNRAEARVFRASAYRSVDAPDLAREDVDAALALRPGLPEALIERGLLKRLAGDPNGARADWLSVIQRAPDSPAADAARENLAQLDLLKTR